MILHAFTILLEVSSCLGQYPTKTNNVQKPHVSAPKLVAAATLLFLVTRHHLNALRLLGVDGGPNKDSPYPKGVFCWTISRL